KYDLGHYEDSEITYYDNAKTKVKEIIPRMHGRKQGKYYLFYENGVTAVEGEYVNNARVKMWREWYDTRQRKSHTMYPTRWHDQKDPVLLRKWNTRGQLTYDIDRGGELKN
ncbi:MAG: hypothetical protein AAFU64_02450, partial [Bacteroidota bacterium]